MTRQTHIRALAIITALALLSLSLAFAAQAESADYTWTRSSPGGGGATFTPAINPADTDMLLLNCDMRNNFLSYDGGASFALYSTSSWMLASHIATENVIYMGGNALMKSTDKGKTFTQIFPAEYSDISYRGMQRAPFYENNSGYNTYHQVRDITTSKQNPASLFVLTKIAQRGENRE